MTVSAASIRPDGSCRLSENRHEAQTVWPSLGRWAVQWFDEWRNSAWGRACDFIDVACNDAIAGVVDALVVLAEHASNDDELAWVGAGPLEDLVSHCGKGPQVLDDVDRAARQNTAFRAALASTWLGTDVPTPVRDRLALLGARLLHSG